MKKNVWRVAFCVIVLAFISISAFTVSTASANTLLDLKALSTKRIWFAHQSVGNMIMHGPAYDDAAGLTRIFLDNPSGGVNNVPSPGSIADIPPGTWADSWNGENLHPQSKIDAFNTAVRTTFQGQLDFAILKFCWVDFYVRGADIQTNGQVDSLWQYYQNVMDSLERSYPGRIIYTTVPVSAAIDSGGDAGNPLRERFSKYVRNKYGPTGRVFDVADLESRDASGNLVLGTDGARMLNNVWNWDGGHPNAAGENMLANNLLHLIAAVASDPPATPVPAISHIGLIVSALMLIILFIVFRPSKSALRDPNR